MPEISAIAVVIYDADFDQILFSKKPHEQRSIASLTKIMSILYICELIQQDKLSFDDVVTVSANAASRGGTSIKLNSGDKLTVEDLLYAAALSSANDATVALAEYAAGSEKEFARLLSERASELGLKNTNFVDSTGLLSIYSGNYSTAYEMALLSRYSMGNELFHKLVSSKEYELEPQDRVIRNSNILLHELEGVEGIKTGATTPAGHTLITSAVRGGRRIIIVMLGAPSREVRNEESEELLEYTYDQLKVIIPQEQVITQVRVPDGVTHQVEAVLERDLSLFMFGTEVSKVETIVKLLDKRAPLEKGEKIGELTVFQDGEEIGTMDLVAKQSTGLASILRRVWNRIVNFFADLF